MPRRLARGVAALFSLAVGGLFSLHVVHRLGYEVQIPVETWRYPLARRSARLYQRPTTPTTPPPFRGDESEYVPEPIVKCPQQLGNGSMWHPDPELGWLTPPGGVVFDRAVDDPDNFMAPGERPWRQVANNFGFADADFARVKPAGEFRIGFFGGSVAHNGSSNDRTISACLQEALRASGHARVRCLNFGHSGWVVTQEIAAYAQIGADLDLDMIVAFDGANDLVAPTFTDAERRPGYRQGYYKQQALLGQREAPALLEDVARRSGYPSDAWRDRLVETYVVSLRRFRRLFPRERPFVVVPQPMAAHVEQTHLAEYHGSEPSIRHTLGVFDAVFERVGAVATAEGIALLDVRDVVRQDRKMNFWDMVHIDDRGNRAVGTGIAELVGPLVPR